MSRESKDSSSKLRLVGTDADKGRRKAREPQPPECPDYLGPIAREEWVRIAPELTAAGLLTELDVPIFAVYCETFEQWREAQVQLNEHGHVQETTDGLLELSPWAVAANQAADQLVALSSQLGLTPASRAQINASRS